MTRVAVIGGGPSGIAAAKEALEAGLEPVVFEKSAAFGGLWCAENGGMWNGMRTNLSRYSCVFSDRPWPADAPDFPTACEVGNYLQGYADAFGVTEHQRLQTEVRSVERGPHDWRVSSSTPDGKTRTEQFPYVVAASGIFQQSHIPPVPGLDIFGGKKSHSAGYKSPDAFRDRHVVVVGGAYSGNEIAVNLVEAGIAVTQIVPAPAWNIGRYMPGSDLPIDLAFYTHKKALTKPKTTAEKNRDRNRYFATTFGNPGDRHEGLRIDPESSAPVSVVVSDRYLDYVKDGRIAVRRGRVASADANSLILDDATKLKADAVIFCTGYRLDLPFFDEKTKRAIEYDEHDSFAPVILHKETFHPDLPGLAFAGLYRGPYFGIMELQARWAAQSFSGALQPVAKEVMAAGLEEARGIRAATPRPQFPRGDYVGFADDIAGAVGVKPDAAQETSAVAALLSEGPVIPPHYRLQGPGAKRGVALQALGALEKRMNSGRAP